MNRILPFLLLILLLPACAGQQEIATLPAYTIVVRGERPPIDDDLGQLAPPGFPAATWIQFSAVRKSRLNKIVTTLVEMNLPPTLPRKLILSILKQSDEILSLNGCEGKGNPTFVTIIKGRFDANGVIEKLSHRKNASPEDLVSVQGIRMGPLLAFAATPQTLVLGTAEGVRQSASFLGENTNNIYSDDLFRDFTPGDTEGIFRFRKGDANVSTCALKGSPLAMFRWVNQVQTADATLQLDTGAKIDSTFTMPDAKRAARARKDLQGELNRALSNPFLRLLNVGWIKKRILFHHEKNQVDVGGIFSNKDIGRFNKLVDPLIQIRKMMGN